MINSYILDVAETYCRKLLSKGGPCIFIHETFKFNTFNLEDFSSDLDIEVLRVKIQSPFTKLCLLSIYSSLW